MIQSSVQSVMKDLQHAYHNFMNHGIRNLTFKRMQNWIRLIQALPSPNSPSLALVWWFGWRFGAQLCLMLLKSSTAMNGSLLQQFQLCTKSLNSCFQNTQICFQVKNESRNMQCVWRNSKKIERENLKKNFRSEKWMASLLKSVRVCTLYSLLIMSLIRFKLMANGLAKYESVSAIWIMHPHAWNEWNSARFWAWIHSKFCL